MKKIFLICPVRNASEIQKQNMANYIANLEKNGDVVYYPARDTNQNDPIGFRICSDNKNGISASDEVHIYWDKTSNGTLFDLGMAFALGKKIVIVNKEEIEKTEGKSFANMVCEWERQSESWSY